MREIGLADFLLIAELHTGVDARLLARRAHVVALAESALAAPFASFDGRERFPAMHEKAGVYCARIVANHPLPDGNRRTAYDVMREFLDRNGAPFTHPRGGLRETADVIENLAAGTLVETRFLEWVRRRIDG